jgi:protein-L-isoaspartate O-methyltransferase
VSLVEDARTMMQLRALGITDARWAGLLARHRRKDFAGRSGPDDLLLPIRGGQSVLPVVETVALIDALGPVDGKKIALIGGGSGWSGALLAGLGAEITVFERVEVLADALALRLEGEGAIAVRFADGFQVICAEGERFQAVLVCASMTRDEFDRLQSDCDGAVVAPVSMSDGVCRVQSSVEQGRSGLTISATPLRSGTVRR